MLIIEIFAAGIAVASGIILVANMVKEMWEKVTEDA